MEKWIILGIILIPVCWILIYYIEERMEGDE